tara:strand:- start:263 stop:505 length:243 start_codon:yes stop_codon:yes gene_type:complete
LAYRFKHFFLLPVLTVLDKADQNYISLHPNKVMNWEEKDEDIQKRIDWISATIRDTKFQLHQEHKELEKLLKEQEEHRKR